MKVSSIFVCLLGLTLAKADKPSLPVLYRVDQPNSNVIVFRGADVARARAAGLLPGGPYQPSPPKPAPYVPPITAAPPPYVPPTTAAPPPPPPTTTYAPPTTPKPPPPPPPSYRPAPVRYSYRPAPVVYKPAPVVYKPAPIVYKPAPPVVYHPAPKPYKPAPAPHYPAPAAYPAYPDVEPNYNWEYAVNDQHYNNFGHKESRDHYVANGVYYVDLPDGRTQTVTYIADENGYRPVVTYSGEAKYPDTYAPKPGYSA